MWASHGQLDDLPTKTQMTIGDHLVGWATTSRPMGTCSEGSSPLLSNQITIPSPYLLSRHFFMPLSPFTMIQNHNNNSYSLPIMLHPIPSNPLQRKHRHRRNVTSHHFKSFLFTSFHFYVYSNFFDSYQLKSKYNTHTHIQQLIISLHFSSLHTLTSIINWKAKTIQIY